VVLMDLRGLRADNRGSLHELRVLTRAHRVRRIVLLFDEHTDREAAHAAMGATGARFVWHDARQRSRGARERVLALLLEGSPGPSPGGPRARANLHPRASNDDDACSRNQWRSARERPVHGAAPAILCAVSRFVPAVALAALLAVPSSGAAAPA